MNEWPRNFRILAATERWTLASRGRALWVREGAELTPRKVGTLPSTDRYEAMHRIRLYRRLTRAEPTAALMIDHDVALVLDGTTLWRVDLAAGLISSDFVIPGQRKALHLSLVQGITGIPDGVYLGEYTSNPARNPISVWRRDPSGDWSVVHEFGQGAEYGINHVHAVVPDPVRDCVWVLAGDFDNAAGIWCASGDWSSLQRVVGGEQTYRAAWLWPLTDRLLYATDTPLEPNALCELRTVDGEWRVTRLTDLPGSSIYGVASGSDWYFSTAVEPDTRGKSGRRALLTRTSGPGIADDIARVYRLSPNGELVEVFSAPKDVWPMGAFQFGTAHLVPHPEGGVYAYVVALSRLDGQTHVVR